MPNHKQEATGTDLGDFLYPAEKKGRLEAFGIMSAAKRRAQAKAAALLAARECPADLIEWGRLHNIPTFAEVTWQAGFLAGMAVALMDEGAADDPAA